MLTFFFVCLFFLFAEACNRELELQADLSWTLDAASSFFRELFYSQFMFLKKYKVLLTNGWKSKIIKNQSFFKICIRNVCMHICL